MIQNPNTDGTCRYGNAFRRAVVRTSCYEMDSMPAFSLVLLENDPLCTCPRRKKGQASCSNLTCSQCDSSVESLNLVSASNDSAVGAITHAFAKKAKMIDRHFILATNHGIVGPDDIDWEEMNSSRSGEFLINLRFPLKSLKRKLFPTLLIQCWIFKEVA